MIDFLNKSDFYKAILKGRLPIATARFVLERGERGMIEFFSTPLGTVLKVSGNYKGALTEIKMYDRLGGDFEVQNVFCGDNLVKTEEGEYVGVSCRLQIEDVVGRSFLIKCDGLNIVAKAHIIEKPNLDKHARLVYN